MIAWVNCCVVLSRCTAAVKLNAAIKIDKMLSIIITVIVIAAFTVMWCSNGWLLCCFVLPVLPSLSLDCLHSSGGYSQRQARPVARREGKCRALRTNQNTYMVTRPEIARRTDRVRNLKQLILPIVSGITTKITDVASPNSKSMSKEPERSRKIEERINAHSHNRT